MKQILLTLSMIKRLGNQRIRDLLSRGQSLSPSMLQEFITEIFHMYSDIEIPSKEGMAKLYAEAGRLLEISETNGIFPLTILDSDYPPKLKHLKSAPVMLFTKGDRDILGDDGFAVIGTRKVSPVGEKWGERLGEVLAEHELTVISGLALGSDTSAHRGCLNRKGRTIAILGNGLDKVYPAKNKNLATEIIDNGGCLVSEYPIGTPVQNFRLIQRDRIQAGLSDGVIVIETTEDGGSMHAVNTAKHLKRSVAYLSYPSSHYEKYPQATGNRDFIAGGEYGISDSATLNKFLSDNEGKGIIFEQPWMC